MTAADYKRSITIDLADVPGPDAAFVEAARSMGYANRLATRKMARDLGMKTLPVARIYVNGRAVQTPTEDLTVLLPDETP